MSRHLSHTEPKKGAQKFDTLAISENIGLCWQAQQLIYSDGLRRNSNDDIPPFLQTEIEALRLELVNILDEVTTNSTRFHDRIDPLLQKGETDTPVPHTSKPRGRPPRDKNLSQEKVEKVKSTKRINRIAFPSSDSDDGYPFHNDPFENSSFFQPKQRNQTASSSSRPRKLAKSRVAKKDDSSNDETSTDEDLKMDTSRTEHEERRNVPSGPTTQMYQNSENKGILWNFTEDFYAPIQEDELLDLLSPQTHRSENSAFFESGTHWSTGLNAKLSKISGKNPNLPKVPDPSSWRGSVNIDTRKLLASALLPEIPPQNSAASSSTVSASTSTPNIDEMSNSNTSNASNASEAQNFKMNENSPAFLDSPGSLDSNESLQHSQNEGFKTCQFSSFKEPSSQINPFGIAYPPPPVLPFHNYLQYEINTKLLLELEGAGIASEDDNQFEEDFDQQKNELQNIFIKLEKLQQEMRIGIHQMVLEQNQKKEREEHYQDLLKRSKQKPKPKRKPRAKGDQ